MSERDLVGYGAAPPDPRWPGGARLALSFVLNYEEGGENTPLEGDPASEAFLHEVVGAPPTVGRRNLNTESMFEFGSRVGLLARPPHLHRARPAADRLRGRPGARANPAAARAMVDAGWEVASHGWRWIDYGEMPEDEEREHIRRAIEAIERRVRQSARSAGTRAAVSEQHAAARRRGGRLPLRLGLVRRRAPVLGRGRRPAPPRHPVHARRERLQVPAPERVRHRRRLRRPTWSTRSTQLHAEGGRMMSVGLHCRIVGRPGPRAGARPLPRARRAHDDVWVTTRAEIARHWHAEHHGSAATSIRLAVDSLTFESKEASWQPRPSRWTREASSPPLPQTLLQRGRRDGRRRRPRRTSPTTRRSPCRPTTSTFAGADEIRRMFTDFFAASVSICHEIRNIVVEPRRREGRDRAGLHRRAERRLEERHAQLQLLRLRRGREVQAA